MAELSLLDVLNANCGDVLKAHVLNRDFGFSINPVALRMPKGEAEAAFAEERAKLAENQPVRTAEVVLAEIKRDHERRQPKVVETLPAMPVGTHFEDVDPIQEAKSAPPVEVLPAAPASSTSLPPGEYDIGGRVYVTLLRAAELRQGSIGAVQQAAWQHGWERIPHPEDGRKVLFLKEVVEASRVRRARAA